MGGQTLSFPGSESPHITSHHGPTQGAATCTRPPSRASANRSTRLPQPACSGIILKTCALRHATAVQALPQSHARVQRSSLAAKNRVEDLPALPRQSRHGTDLSPHRHRVGDPSHPMASKPTQPPSMTQQFRPRFRTTYQAGLKALRRPGRNGIRMVCRVSFRSTGAVALSPPARPSAWQTLSNTVACLPDDESSAFVRRDNRRRQKPGHDGESQHGQQHILPPLLKHTWPPFLYSLKTHAVISAPRIRTSGPSTPALFLTQLALLPQGTTRRESARPASSIPPSTGTVRRAKARNTPAASE